MKHKMPNFRLGMLVPAALAGLLLFSPPARAGFIFSLQPGITASPGSTGNVFDVLLTNTGPSTVTVGGFSFGITTSDADISFTVANTSTTVATYVFFGNSFDDNNAFPLFTNSLPGQTVEASDFPDSGPGANVAAAATFGVGHIMFNIASNATPGPFAVTFEDAPTTSLSDAGGNALALTATPGTITISGTTTVPEPNPGGLVIFALAGFAILLQWRRRCA